MCYRTKIARGMVSLFICMAGHTMASESQGLGDQDLMDAAVAPPSAPALFDVASPSVFAECEKTNGKWVGVFDLSNGYVIEHDDLQVHVFHKASPSLHVSGRMLNFYKNSAFFEGCPVQSDDGLLKVETTLAEFTTQVRKFGEIMSHQVINRYVPQARHDSSYQEDNRRMVSSRSASSHNDSSQMRVAPRSTRNMDYDNGLWGGPVLDEEDDSRESSSRSAGSHSDSGQVRVAPRSTGNVGNDQRAAFWEQANRDTRYDNGMWG